MNYTLAIYGLPGTSVAECQSYVRKTKVVSEQKLLTERHIVIKPYYHPLQLTDIRRDIAFIQFLCGPTV